jgi:exonuclease III
MSFCKDFAAIQDFDADVIFIQECEELSQDYFPNFTFHWIGNNQKKGLGILTKGPSRLANEIYNANFVYFLPVVYNDIHLLGAWSFNHRAKKFGEEMSGYFLEVLDHYREWINQSSQVVIAGDFNNGPQWDKPRNPNNFVDINQALENHGLISTYHAHTGEEFGSENNHTYFHQRKSEQKYHIDYIYSKNKEVEIVEIGSFKDWSHLSDHVPLITTFAE